MDKSQPRKRVKPNPEPVIEIPSTVIVNLINNRNELLGTYDLPTDSGPQQLHELLLSLLSRKCMHILSFSCWFLMIFLGTTILGISTSNNSVTLDFCTDSEPFCTNNILVNASGRYYLYVKLTGMHQNNRQYPLPHPASWMPSASTRSTAKSTTLIVAAISTPTAASQPPRPLGATGLTPPPTYTPAARS